MSTGESRSSTTGSRVEPGRGIAAGIGAGRRRGGRGCCRRRGGRRRGPAPGSASRARRTWSGSRRWIRTRRRAPAPRRGAGQGERIGSAWPHSLAAEPGIRPCRRCDARPVMDAWELDDLEAARVASGRLYHEFLRVPDLSAGLYVLEAGRDRSAVAPRRGRDVRRHVRPGGRSPSVTRIERSARARSCSSAATSRIVSTTSRSGWSCSSGSGRRRARGRASRPGSSDRPRHEGQRELRAPPRHRRGGRRRRHQPRRRGTARGAPPRHRSPRRRSRGGAAADTADRRPPDGRRLLVLRRLGGADRGPGRREARGHLVVRPRGIGQFEDERHVSRPRREQRRRGGRRRGRTLSGTRNSTVPSRSPKARYGPVSHGMPASGSAANDRNVPPRWALTRTGSRVAWRPATRRPWRRWAAGRTCC